ncbi:MAG TPA: condensation domain-containing protein, partial [Candidatus Dormibacteraeota bacterium]|nr:condensation domain-containing protein [Candidatus Dormibacteraeota bacterium]
PARDVVGRARALRRRLEPAAAEAVLGPAPAALDATVHEVLLAALAVAVEEWCWRRGRDEGSVVVDVEGHGREAGPGRDLSRTVGWFTSVHPLRLDLGGLDAAEALAGGRALGLAVRRVRDELRGLPDRGTGYGVLRHLDPVAGPELARLAAPELGFNYLGRFAGAAGEDDFEPAPEADALAGGADPELPLAHALELNALASDAGLTAIWSWSPGVLDAGEVGELADGWFQALRALARPAAAPGDDDLEDLLRRWDA